MININAYSTEIYEHEFTAVMLIETEEYNFILAEGGAHPDSQAATCMIKAYLNKENKGSLIGELQSVDTDIYTYDIKKNEKREIKVNKNEDFITIDGVDTFGLCGLGVDFNGKYTKIDKDSKTFTKEVTQLRSLMSQQERKELKN